MIDNPGNIHVHQTEHGQPIPNLIFCGCVLILPDELGMSVGPHEESGVNWVRFMMANDPGDEYRDVVASILVDVHLAPVRARELADYLYRAIAVAAEAA